MVRASLKLSTVSYPKIFALPEVLFTSPVKIPIVVVFHAPFGPSKPKKEPFRNTKVNLL